MKIRFTLTFGSNTILILLDSRGISCSHVIGCSEQHSCFLGNKILMLFLYSAMHMLLQHNLLVKEI